MLTRPTVARREWSSTHLTICLTFVHEFVHYCYYCYAIANIARYFIDCDGIVAAPTPSVFRRKLSSLY